MCHGSTGQVSAANGRKWIKFICAAVNISLWSPSFTGCRLPASDTASVDGAKCQSAGKRMKAWQLNRHQITLTENVRYGSEWPAISLCAARTVHLARNDKHVRCSVR